MYGTNLGYFLIAATLDRLPISNSSTSAIVLNEDSPVYLTKDGTKFAVCNGTVDADDLSTLMAQVKQSGWIALPNDSLIPETSTVVYRYNSYNDPVSSVGTLHSWGLSPQQPTDL